MVLLPTKQGSTEPLVPRTRGLATARLRSVFCVLAGPSFNATSLPGSIGHGHASALPRSGVFGFAIARKRTFAAPNPIEVGR